MGRRRDFARKVQDGWERGEVSSVFFFPGLLDDGEISRFDHPRVLANRKKPA